MPDYKPVNYQTAANDTVGWRYLDRMLLDWSEEELMHPLEQLNLSGLLEFMVYELNMDLSMLVIAMINADQMNFED